MNKFELPESYRNYRESAQWILTLAVGGLAGFVGIAGSSEKIAAAGFWIKTLFFLTGLVVLAAVIACAFFIFYIVELGNALEVEYEIKSKIAELEARAKTENDLSQTDKDRRKAAKIKKDKAVNWYPFCFKWLLRTFVLSLVLYFAIFSWFLRSPFEKAEQSRYEFAPFEFSADHHSGICILNKNTGELYRLSKNSNVWIRIGGTNKIEATPADFSQGDDHRTNELSAQLEGIRNEIARLNAKLSEQLSAESNAMAANIATMTDELRQIEAAVMSLSKAMPTNAPAQQIDFGPVTNELIKIRGEIENLAAKIPLQSPATNAPQPVMRRTGVFIDIGREELKSH